MSRFLTPEDCNSKREALHEVLPLVNGPFCIRFMVTLACNFKCYYCDYQNREFKAETMTFEDFKKCVDHLDGFERFKVFNFTGGGEPLTHKDIARMVEYVKNKDITKTIEITTNGSLLTHQMSDALLSAGVDRVKVSLQGRSSQAYRETCGVAVDYDELKEQLCYFRDAKGPDVILFAKIIDQMIPTPEERSSFIHEYQDIVDEYEIDCLFPTPSAKEAVSSEYNNTLYGHKVVQYSICPQPFYSATIYPNGYAYPCCPLPNPAPLCNMVTERLADHWHGPKHLAFLCQHLRGERDKIPVCSECTLFQYISAPKDALDPYAAELLKKYEDL